MLTDFKESITKKTDEELLEYLSNIDRYSPEALACVIRELKIRGRKFSDEELRKISEQIRQQNINDEKEYVFRPFFTLKKNVVTDLKACFDNGLLYFFFGHFRIRAFFPKYQRGIQKSVDCSIRYFVYLFCAIRWQPGAPFFGLYFVYQCCWWLPVDTCNLGLAYW